ncbi:MAG: Putative oxidoreductase SadH [Legionellaceae bacterium]
MNILITGCNTGLGYELAVGLSKKGYQVIATILKEEDKILFQNTTIKCVTLDLTNKESIASCVEKTLLITNNKIDILINNAGIVIPGALEDISYDTIRNQFNINVFGLHEITRLTLPSMHENNSGTIINISSMLGSVVFPYRSIYSASKFALKAITHGLRQELKTINSPIKVILIESGPIKTNIRSNAIKLANKYIPINTSRYQENYKKLLLATKNDDPLFTKLPEEMVKFIQKILVSKQPKAIYQFGALAKIANFMGRFFSLNLLDKTIAKIFTFEVEHKDIESKISLVNK